MIEKLCAYRQYSNGLIIEPCGTPWEIGEYWEKVPLSLTRKCLPDK